MFPITRYAVETLPLACITQPIDVHYLTTLGFIKGKTLLYRKTKLEPRTFVTLWEIPGRRGLADEAEALLAAMERGEVEPPVNFV